MPSALIKICIAAAGLLALQPSLVAATIRASFLTERAVLRNTVGVARSAGCTPEATAAFQRAVERYSSTAMVFDFSRFPKPRDGFYSFESASNLVSALPHPLCETQHAYEFNCFDTIISLAGEQLHPRVQADELAGPYLVPHTPTNGAFMIVPRATARDAFMLAYPSWYRGATEDALPKSITDVRVSLMAALFRCYMLPQSATEGGLAIVVKETLNGSWSRHGISVPARFEVVLCHEVNLPGRWFVTAHAGLLFPRQRGYTYIEKSGGSGPFVRLDFDDRAALLTWLGGMFRGAEKLGYTQHFATFNDTKIEMLEFLKK